MHELCVFVFGARQSSWEGLIQQTWATERTVFVHLRGHRGGNTGHAGAISDIEDYEEGCSNDSNCSRRPGGLGLWLHLDPTLGLNDDRPHFRALSLWSALREKLLLAHSNRSSGSLTPWLESCYWLMHVDGTSYVNVKRVAQRLSCVKGLRPEYYGVSPMIGEARVALADEATGYILSRQLLLSLPSEWIMKCADYYSGSDDAYGFGWNWPSGFYMSLCLWQQQRLMLQRLGDPEQEVLMHALPDEPRSSTIHRLRKLHPSGHCVLVVAAKTTANLLEIHRRVRLLGPLEDPARDIVRNEVGCFVQSLAEPLALAPPWSYRVARSIARCPLKVAVSQTELGLSVLKHELLAPSQPTGPAAERLRAGRGRRLLCILMPATDATPKQVDRAVSAVQTWAKPYLFSESDKESPGPVLALLYSRRPLFASWANATLSLRGDVDIRHPKFNALRFIYMWLTLALYHSSDSRICLHQF